MPVHGGGPGRCVKSSSRENTQRHFSSQATSRECQHRRRSPKCQGIAAQIMYPPLENGDHAGHGDCDASSISDDVAGIGLRLERATTRCLARLLAGLTLQWREVMTDLREAQAPLAISDATSSMGSPMPTRSCRVHRHWTPPVLRRRRCSRSDLAKKTVTTASYLTQDLHFNVQDREEVRRRGQHSTLSETSSDCGDQHPYNCLRGPAEKPSDAEGWHSLIPAVRWIPYLVKDGAEGYDDAYTGPRRDPHESGVLHLSPHSQRWDGPGSEEWGKGGGEDDCNDSDESTDVQLHCAALLEAARSVEVTMHGMRRVRAVLSAAAAAAAVVTDVCDDDTDRGTRRESPHRGLYQDSSEFEPMPTQRDGAVSDAETEASRVPTHRCRHRHQSQREKPKKQIWRCHECHAAHTQRFSTTAQLDGTRCGKESRSRHGLDHSTRRDVSGIRFTGAALPSNLQRQSPSPGGSRFSTAVAPAEQFVAPAGVPIYPAPPASERIHIYPHAGERGHGLGDSGDNGGSTTISIGAAVSPLRHRRCFMATTDVSAPGSQSHMHRKLGWWRTVAATPVTLDTTDALSGKRAASMNSHMQSPSEPTVQASSTRLATLQTVAATARGTPEGSWTALLQKEGEARLRIVMTHNSHLLHILQGHYKSLRELEWGYLRYSAGSEDEAVRRRVSAWKAAASETTIPATADHVANPLSSLSTTQPSLSPSVPSLSSGIEVSSQVTIKPMTTVQPTRSQRCDLDGEGETHERLSSTPTFAADVVIFSRDVPPLPLQTSQSVEEEEEGGTSDALNMRGGATSSSSAPAPLPTHPLPAQGLQLCPPPLENPSATSRRLPIPGTDQAKYDESTSPIMRQLYTRPHRTTSGLLVSPLEKSDDEIVERGASSNSHSRKTERDISGSSATYVVSESLEQCAPSGLTVIATGPTATRGDRTPLIPAPRDSPSPPGASADGVYLDDAEEIVQLTPFSESVVPRRMALAMALFPTDATHDSTTSLASAPPLMPPTLSPPALLPAPEMSAVGEVDGTEEAVANSLSSMSYSSRERS